MRHPKLLKFIESANQGTKVVTEKVSPLALVLGEMGEDGVGSGIYSLLEGLKFLHSQGNAIFIS